MNHLNTKKSFSVSDILEKLPKNSSKVSILFQMSGIWKGFWHFPWINNSFIKQLSSNYPELRLFWSTEKGGIGTGTILFSFEIELTGTFGVFSSF